MPNINALLINKTTNENNSSMFEWYPICYTVSLSDSLDLVGRPQFTKTVTSHTSLSPSFMCLTWVFFHAAPHQSCLVVHLDSAEKKTVPLLSNLTTSLHSSRGLRSQALSLLCRESKARAGLWPLLWHIFSSPSHFPCLLSTVYAVIGERYWTNRLL